MEYRSRRIANRYELSAPLDGGGMGVVWEGYDTVLDRPVAVKRIRAEKARTPGQRAELAQRFKREARVTARIEHPGVPAVYDAAIDRDPADENALDELYLVMQLVRGRSLGDILAEHGEPLPLAWAVSIAAQICSVLSFAHAVPVVHRDLKPGNVMIDDTGHVKVLDFGVAAVLGTDVTQITDTGQMVGTRDYMSPEQFHGVGVSPRSDLYALGCLLHEMLSGGKVFDGTSDPALQHVHEEPVPLRVLNPGVPPELEDLVLDLLAKAPEDRPASAEEVHRRLSPYLPGPGQAAEPVAPAVTGVPNPTRPYRRPLAPRQQPVRPAASALPGPEPSTPPEQPPAVAMAELKEAEEHAFALIDEERFSQAVGVLEEVIAASPVGPDHPRMLEIRETHAAALVLGRDYRRGLVAFQALIASWSRIDGPESERAVEYRQQAAVCLAALGETEDALAEYRALLSLAEQRGRTPGGGSVGELRRRIGDLLLAAHRIREAAHVFRALLAELTADHGPEHPEAREIRDLLTRIEFTGGT
ncbi:serine/threonine-protein kinase [Streptomyces aidingensis]|uniref:non-specific serine/threonine protein kinase n=1 Tax=Streptomyces aidingensis TaxID=910347 RepID=A0A1I1MH34_9ACTN|nr:serine/threonine-protein kinase [Streptomyces aidingensis]SFC82408.1 Serine/threonine protein kinase [Streptomyces aidingensis]